MKILILVLLLLAPPVAAAKAGELPAGFPVEVLLVNRTAAPVELFWVDKQGREWPYGVLAPGDEQVRGAIAGSVLRFRQSGHPLGSYAVQPIVQQRHEIRLPEPELRSEPQPWHGETGWDRETAPGDLQPEFPREAYCPPSRLERLEHVLRSPGAGRAGRALRELAFAAEAEDPAGAAGLRQLAVLADDLDRPGMDIGRVALERVAGLLAERGNEEAAARLQGFAALDAVLGTPDGTPAALEKLAMLAGGRDSGETESLRGLAALARDFEGSGDATSVLRRVAELLARGKGAAAVRVQLLAELNALPAAAPGGTSVALEKLSLLVEGRDPAARERLRLLAVLAAAADGSAPQPVGDLVGTLTDLMEGDPESAALLANLGTLGAALSGTGEESVRRALVKGAKVLRRKNPSLAETFTQLAGPDAPRGGAGGEMLKTLALKTAATLLSQQSPEAANALNQVADGTASWAQVAQQGAALLLEKNRGEIARSLGFQEGQVESLAGSLRGGPQAPPPAAGSAGVVLAAGPVFQWIDGQADPRVGAWTATIRNQRPVACAAEVVLHLVLDDGSEIVSEGIRLDLAAGESREIAQRTLRLPSAAAARVRSFNAVVRTIG